MGGTVAKGDQAAMSSQEVEDTLGVEGIGGVTGGYPLPVGCCGDAVKRWLPSANPM